MEGEDGLPHRLVIKPEAVDTELVTNKKKERGKVMPLSMQCPRPGWSGRLP